MNELPRIDLREPAFRKYEPYIIKACHGELVVDPIRLNMKASTFMARFRDAVLAYKKYNYHSGQIPRDNPLDFKIVELDTGEVKISSRRQIIGGRPAFDRDAVHDLVKELSARTKTGPYDFFGLSDDDLAWLQSLQDVHMYDIVVTIKGNHASVL